MGRTPLVALSLVLVMLFSVLIPADVNNEVLGFQSTSEVSFKEDNWTNNGASRTDLNLSEQGKPVLERPELVWTSVSGSPIGVTGSAAVAIDELNQVWFIGGREDPNPAQSNDEVASTSVHIYDVANDSWISGNSMPFAQQYGGAERIGERVLVFGDWWPTNSNPVKDSSGMLQIYNMSNETWYEGASLPDGHMVGNAGVTTMDGYLYVSGGVKKNTGQNPSNKTFRYDPETDEWITLADMNRSRWGLTLTAFDGKLYAMGGANHTSSSWWIQPVQFDDVEIYDPSNDTWWDLPDMPRSLFGHASVVVHDEILVIAGRSGSNSKKTWGFDPHSGIWQSHGDISIGLLDLAAVVINGTVVVGTGDLSSYLYSNWNVMYANELNTAGNFTWHEGWLNSKSIDLRPSMEFTCKPTSFQIIANTTDGTYVQSQLRGHIQPSGLSSAMWEGPDGSISTWFEPGSNIVSLGQANHIEYRVRMATEELQNWTVPELDELTIHADHVGFHQPPPLTMHPLAESTQIITGHHISGGSQKDVLWLSTADAGVPSLRANLSRTSAGTLSIDDPHGILFEGSSVEILSSSSSGYNLSWNLSLADGINAQNLRFGVISTNSDDDTLEHLLSDTIHLDDNLEVQMSELFVKWGNGDWANFSQGGTIPAGAEIKVSAFPFFPSTGTEHEGTGIDTRLFASLIMEDVSGNITWWNISTEWSELNSVREHSIQLPEGNNGTLNVWLEARSILTYNMTSGADMVTLVVDDSGPILYGSIPANNSYINSENNRNVSIILWEPGGLNEDSIVVEVWVEAVNDGNASSPLDGIAQADEFVERLFTVEQLENLVYLNFTVNDSSNFDHGKVEVVITGRDNVDFPFPENSANSPLLTWLNRAPKNAVIDGIVANGTIVDGKGLRLEPGITSGWIIELSDANSLLDISMLTLNLGGDSQLGVRWMRSGGVCNSIDERLIAESVSCTATFTEESLFIDISFAPTWRVNLSELELGKLEIEVVDLDGNMSYQSESSWFLATDLVVSNLSINDLTGTVFGEISNGHVLALGDELLVSGDITHGSSGIPMQGLVILRWSGIIHDEEWSGEQVVELVAGKLSSQLLDPPRGGQGEIKIEILDEMGWQTIAASEIISLTVDSESPELLPPAAHNPPSRYHLSHIIVTASISDDVEFNNSATAECQVISDGIEWPVASVTAEPVGVFEDRSVYSFQFNMSGLGRPSDLPIASQLICWISAWDDSGRSIIVSQGGNSNDTPWLTLSLTNNGPNLKMSSFTSDRTSTVIGDRFRVSMVVNNVGEAVEVPLFVNITMTSPDGTVMAGWAETRNGGLTVNGIWTITIDLWPEETGEWIFTATVDPLDVVPELIEDDNSLSIIVSLEAKPEGFLSQIKTPAIWSSIGLVVVLLAVMLLRRIRIEELLDDEVEDTIEPEIEEPSRPVFEPLTSSPPVSQQSQERANAALDSLLVQETVDTQDATKIPPVGAQVTDWQGLAWAGDYQYESDGTWYVGPECGRWKQNEDGSFTRKS